jgi:crotonobetainyl-CoA:carnitine CoA-transferase CaiB-like acyl-CoA transferase
LKVALEGIKVIDLSQVAAVPMSARHLADFGADVIHIENPRTGDSWRVYLDAMVQAMNAAPSKFDYGWETYNRNKRSLTLDVSKPTGKKVLDNLIKQADVFLCNMRTVELERYGLAYSDIKKINQRIICGYLSGYGHKGPDADTPAYDTTAYWSRSGIPQALSVPGVPVVGYRAAFGDNLAALCLAYGIMTALYVREKTGIGQEIDVSLLHAGLYQLSFDINGALVTGLDFSDWRENPPAELVENAQKVNQQIGAFYTAKLKNPLNAVYDTKDGRHIRVLSLQPDRYWNKFCFAIGREDLANNPKYQTTEGRAQYSIELRQTIEKTILTKTLKEWVPLLEGMPYAPIQTPKEAAFDPQTMAAGCIVSYDHPSFGQIMQLASPINMSETPATYRLPAPEFGQHTEQVLLEYGYTWEDIAQFKEEGVIA